MSSSSTPSNQRLQLPASSSNRASSAPPFSSFPPSRPNYTHQHQPPFITSIPSTREIYPNRTINFNPILQEQSNYHNTHFPPPDPATMPHYSSSSSSSYSHPRINHSSTRPQPNPRPTATPTTPSWTELNSLITTLRSRRVNTLTELRRIEKVLAPINVNGEYTGVLTDAWNNYVSSNNFLNELRGLTRAYPFSSEMVEDAKWRVYEDVESGRSWNFAWLLLGKIRNDGLIQEYAMKTAYQPAMWGGVQPDRTNANQLANVLVQEWTRAVDQMLRNWGSGGLPVTD